MALEVVGIADTLKPGAARDLSRPPVIAWRFSGVGHLRPEFRPRRPGRGILDLGDLREGDLRVLAADRSHGRYVVASSVVC